MSEISVVVNEEFSLHNFLLPALQTLVNDKGLNKSQDYPELSFEITGLKPRSHSYSTNIDVVVKFRGMPFAKGQTYYHMYCDTNLHSEMKEVQNRIFESFNQWDMIFFPEEFTKKDFEAFVDFCHHAREEIKWFGEKYKVYAMYKSKCSFDITEKHINMLKGYASDVYEDSEAIILERESDVNDIKLVILKKGNGYSMGSTSNKAYGRKKLVDQMLA